MKITVCFAQYGPYHHARVAALQELAEAEGGWAVTPVQIAAATRTYAWSCATRECAGLRTLCGGVEETVPPTGVFFAVRRLLRDEKIEVALLPSYWPARFLALFLAAKSLGIRTVMMNESHAGTEQAAGWKKWIKRQIVKRFDAALVGGTPHRRHFASLGIPKERIFRGYDAVDNEYFAKRADDIRASQSDERQVTSGKEPSTLIPQPSTPQSLRSAYGLPERYFLNLGRMVEKKNLATLIAAYARYADGVAGDGRSKMEDGEAPVSLVLVGSGEEEHVLREQARNLGLHVVDRSPAGEGKQILEASQSISHQPSTLKKKDLGSVFFYGFRQIDENPVFYAFAEAFILPSLREEWGLVVNEAMAACLPVIVSRTAGCAEDLVPEGEGVQHGKIDNRKLTTDDSLEQRSNGFVFDPKSADALAEAMRRISEMEDERSEMGRKSQEIISQWGCDNFARQAMAAAKAAWTVGGARR